MDKTLPQSSLTEVKNYTNLKNEAFFDGGTSPLHYQTLSREQLASILAGAAAKVEKLFEVSDFRERFVPWRLLSFRLQKPGPKSRQASHFRTFQPDKAA